ncbi:MAG: sigma-70 family RNA polymerase sigma factor [Bacteroidetes bacterium]|nr:sigma-70 family RNA polymerase sigma factor [Bacteroidota bacterium]
MDQRLQNIKEGNRQAFHDFYFDQHAKLYYYILKYTRSEWLAEETVQMSFVKLWENRENLSASYSLSIQLFRIAKSIVIDLLRRNAVRKTERLPDQADLHHIFQSSTEQSYPEIKNELEYVRNVIRKMPEVQQQVFSYSRIDGFSHKEIAEKLSISVKTVETHITRAVKHLKKSLSLFFW